VKLGTVNGKAVCAHGMTAYGVQSVAAVMPTSTLDGGERSAAGPERSLVPID